MNSTNRINRINKLTARGFSLVELMVTLVIAAILLSLAVPSFSTTIQNNRLTSQANQFIIAMTFARSEAVKRSATIDIIATSPTGSNEWGGGWKVAVNGGADLKIFPALDGGNTLDSNNDISSFQYLPSGRANVVDSFSLCDSRTGETGRLLSISTTGRVSTADQVCA